MRIISLCEAARAALIALPTISPSYSDRHPGKMDQLCLINTINNALLSSLEFCISVMSDENERSESYCSIPSKSPERRLRYARTQTCTRATYIVASLASLLAPSHSDFPIPTYIMRRCQLEADHPRMIHLFIICSAI